MKIGFLQFGAMADAAYAIPILKHVRKIYPEAHITWCIRDKFAELIETLPYLDDVKRYKLPEGYSSRQEAEHIMWQQMKDEANISFDKVIKPQQWPDHNFWRSGLDLLSLMAENAGFSPSEITDRSIEVFYTSQDIKQHEIFINKNNLNGKKYITCNHISYAAQPMWSLEKYQQLVDNLLEHDIYSVFTGAHNEVIPNRAIDARGMPFRQWGICIKNSHLYLGLDSGAKTLAASTKVPMIILHALDFPLSKTSCRSMGIRTTNIWELCPAPNVETIYNVIMENMKCFFNL